MGILVLFQKDANQSHQCVALLCSEQAAYIYGANLDINSGRMEYIW